ncbi:MAG: DUF3486 family protein [Negativicutes bacterium]|nr:DUF3486 family protein [Negativicutes bacterium]
MAKDRRRHSKITSILPPEVVEAINKRIVSGQTYQEIADYLNQSGHEISKSSIGRYGKEFLSRMERLKIVKEQAKTIVSENKDGPATEMAEAANQLAIQLIMENLLTVDDLNGAKITEVLKALALLERSGVQREKLKMDFKQKIDSAVKQIEKTAEQRGLDADTLRIIKEQVYGIV